MAACRTRAATTVTNAIPVVFMGTSDPVNRRLIATMEKPGGNFTGFIEFESSIGGKWLELLKQTAPSVSGSQGSYAVCLEESAGRD